MEDNNKYTNIENLIKENSHLKNQELAQKIGKSLGWLKAFKAFMNAEDKQKYKDSSNRIYKAIYNIWINDTEAQKKEIEKDKLKKKVRDTKRELRESKKELEELSQLINKLKSDLKKCYEEKKKLEDKFIIVQNKNNYYESKIEEYKKKITCDLEHEFDKKYNKLYTRFKEKEREAEKEKDKYMEYRQDYHDRLNEFEFKKRGILGVIIVEFCVIVYLIFTYVLHISA